MNREGMQHLYTWVSSEVLLLLLCTYMDENARSFVSFCACFGILRLCSFIKECGKMNVRKKIRGGIL